MIILVMKMPTILLIPLFFLSSFVIIGGTFNGTNIGALLIYLLINLAIHVFVFRYFYLYKKRVASWTSYKFIEHLNNQDIKAEEFLPIYFSKSSLPNTPMLKIGITDNAINIMWFNEYVSSKKNFPYLVSLDNISNILFVNPKVGDIGEVQFKVNLRYLFDPNFMSKEHLEWGFNLDVLKSELPNSVQDIFGVGHSKFITQDLVEITWPCTKDIYNSLFKGINL